MVSTADDAVNNQVDKVILSVGISKSLLLGFFGACSIGSFTVTLTVWMELIYGLNNGHVPSPKLMWLPPQLRYQQQRAVTSCKITIFLRETKWPPGGCLSILDPFNHQEDIK